MAKGGSKVLTGIIAFLLGFLFAVIVEVAAIVGLGYHALHTDIDNIFSLFKVENDDGRGNAYVNTGDGGYKTVLDLYNKILDMSQNYGDLTIGELRGVSPALVAVIEDLYVTADEYGVTIDREEIDGVKFSEMGGYMQDVIMDVRPAVVMRKQGMTDSLEQNLIVKTIFEGAECLYVVSGEEKYPVFYDEYISDGESYSLVGGGRYPADIVGDWLTETKDRDENGNVVYRQYFYVSGSGDGTSYTVTRKDENGDYIYSSAEVTGVAYDAAYGAAAVEQKRSTGNYYYDNEGNEVQIDPVTIRTLSEDAFAPLYSLGALEMLSESDRSDGMMNELFGDVSLGELINGEVDLAERIENVSVASVPGLRIEADNEVMVYIGYRIGHLVAVEGQEYAYTATYEFEDGNEGRTVYVYTIPEGEKEVVDRVTFEDGEEVVGTVIKEIADVLDGVRITTFVNVNAGDSLMTYVSYGIRGLKQIEEADGYVVFEGKRTVGDEEETVYIKTVRSGEEDEEQYEIVGFYSQSSLDEDSRIAVPGAKLDQVSDRVGTIKDELTVGEVIGDVSGNRLLRNLTDTTIADLPQAVDDLKLQELYPEDIYTTSFDEEGNPTDYVKATVYFERYTYYTRAEETVDGETVTTYIPATDVTEGTDFSLSDYYYTYDAKEMSVVTEHNFSVDYIYYIKDGEKFVLVNEDTENAGKLSELDDVHTYYTYGAPHGIWKLMLCDGDNEKLYAVNEMADLVRNTTEHMKSSSIADLAEAGIIDRDDVPGNKVPYDIGVSETENVVIYYTKPAGECTLTEIMRSIVYFGNESYAYAFISGGEWRNPANGVTYKIIEVTEP